MELQYYNPNTRDPTSWASVRFLSHETGDTSQVCRRWQGTSDRSDHMENPMFGRYSTEGLASDNSPFSDLKDSRLSTTNHIVIPKPNRVYGQHTGQYSHHGDSHWVAQAPLSSLDENGFKTSPFFVAQDSYKFHGDSRDLSLINSYKHSHIGAPPPSKKYKGSADFHERDEEDKGSAFKVFKRNENNHQFCRIKDRNKNLPPPPPLVKASEKMRKNSKPMEEVIVIRDSPPLDKRCQSVSRHSLRASKLETTPHEIFHHSEPISSVNSVEYQQPISKNYLQLDQRMSMEPMQICHCHHHDLSTLQKGFSQFPRNIRTPQIATPIVTTHKFTRSHYQPHTEIHSYPNCHNGLSFSTTPTGSHKNDHSRNQKLLQSPTPTGIASSQPFCDAHKALHAWRQRSQLPVSSNSGGNNSFVDPDMLRNNYDKLSENLMNSRSPLVISFHKEPPRLCKDHHRSQSPMDKPVFKQSHDNEFNGIHKISEYPCHETDKDLSFVINHKIRPSHKTNHAAKLRKLLKIHSQIRNEQQPLKLPQLRDNQKQSRSQNPRVSSQILEHAPKQQSMLSLLLSAPKSQVKGPDKVAMPLKLSDLAQTTRIRRDSSLPSPFSSSSSLSSSGDAGETWEENKQTAMISEELIPCHIPNRDHPSFLKEEKSREKKGQVISPHEKASRSPPNLDSFENKKSTKETENQSEMSSQSTVSVSPPSVETDKASHVQRNQLAPFKARPKPRRLTYPMEKNHCKINPIPPLQRSASQGDQVPHCDTEVSPLLANLKEDESAPQPCGGYAYDHDSMPIIVAVHSIMVKNDSPQGIESSQEKETKEEKSKKPPVLTSSHSGIDTTQSVSKNEIKRYQRPILPKPDGSERPNLTSGINAPGENQDTVGQTASTVTVMDEKTDNTTSTISYNDNKQMSQTPANIVSVNDASSNDTLEEKVDKAIQADHNNVNIANANVTSSCTSKKSAVVCDEAEMKVKTHRSPLHRRQSVEELSNKIVETRERIDKEEIDWKKRLLRRLEFVLIKKLKKAEKESGEKASIDLPSEKNSKNKEEHKKAKNVKRNKSCSDEPVTKVEHAVRDLDKTQGDSEDKHDEEEKNTVHQPKNVSKTEGVTELDNKDVNEQTTSDKKGQTESLCSKTLSKDDIHEDINEETISNKDETLETSVSYRTDETIKENCMDSLQLPNSEPKNEGHFDLVIAE